MYALRVYINKSVFGKKIIENRQFFQFSIKFFFKMEYYCVSLKYTLVKSFIYIYIYIYFIPCKTQLIYYEKGK